MPELDQVPVTLIGHPFAPIGMGEQLRSHIAACARLQIPFGVLDIFRYAQRADAAHHALIDAHERTAPAGGIRVFHVNGDEVDAVIAAFERRGGDFAAGHNVIVPAWELPTYPKLWAQRLARFDEVWALSGFIQASLAAAGIASHLVGQSVETEPGVLLPRRAFGIRESAFVLLHSFDLSSYATRKNPEAVLTLLRRLRQAAPFLDVQLVLKVKEIEKDAAAWAESFATEATVKIIATPLDTLATRSLLAACDCFVSLHRAEGFGRGLGEAMALGRLALGTGWSGNVDFMTEANSLLVRHTLTKVPADAYPHWQGQHWAEPDLDHAMALLRPVLQDPARGRAIAARGRREVLRGFGHRAVGLRILARLQAIAAESTKLAAPPLTKPPSLAKPAARRRRLAAPA
ncbi:MAG: glycosyl transferase family 1 [Alphaproteobacteria bacterium]|nr:glycosyl transferase family 1 [Alphaproteobacteria bacterium]